MTTSGRDAVSRSSVRLVVSLVIYLVCLAMAVVTRNWALGALGGLGLALWTWQVTTRKKRQSQRPMSQDEAVGYMRSNKGRYVAAIAVIGTGFVVLGLALLIASIRKDDPVGDTLGSLGIVVGAGWFFFLLARMRHRLHEDGSN